MALLLGASFFFSGSETALFSLRRTELRQLSEHPSRVGNIVLALLRDPKDLLVTILFGNTIVNVLFYSLAYGLAERVTTPVFAALWAFAGLFAVVICGEVMPKSAAIHAPLKFAFAVALPLSVFQRFTRPVRAPLGILIDGLTRYLAPAGTDKFVTADELKMLVDLSAKEGALDHDERAMIREVMEMREVAVREVMVPRVDVTFFDLDGSNEEFLDLVRRTHVSKVPVYEERPDNIRGVVYAKDLFLHPDADIREFIRPVLFVPESMTVERLLRQFREQKAQFAIVVDEYGGTAGLVTLEDILEEIVGEIDDEFDRDVEPVRQNPDGSYILAGNLSMRDWAGVFRIRTDPEKCITLGGFVTLLLGHVPKRGDKVRYRNLLFTVEDVGRRRVRRIRLDLVKSPVKSQG